MANQFSKEIHDELDVMAKKYGFVRGILMVEEKDIHKIDENRFRTICFDVDIQPMKVHLFAKMFLVCLNVSKTFQKIIDEVSTQSIIDMMRQIHLDHQLREKKGKND